MPQSRVTSRDVAKSVGVSQTTLSFVLDDVAEARIGEELGYVPDARAQAPHSGDTRTTDLNHPGHARPSLL